MTARSLILPLLLTFAAAACHDDADTSAVDAEANGSGESTVASELMEPGEAPPVADTVSNSDRAIATAVAMALVSASDVDARHFDVHVDGGVVSLTSRAPSRREYDRARDLAAAVRGVTQVQVATPPPTGEGEDIAPPTAAGERDEIVADAVALGTPRTEIPQLPTEEVAGETLDRAASGDRPRTYRVRAGDSLSIIASRTMDDGNAWHRIYELNRNVIGPNPERLVEGMELRIPQD